jgi:hypothetical protein
VHGVIDNPALVDGSPGNPARPFLPGLHPPPVTHPNDPRLFVAPPTATPRGLERTRDAAVIASGEATPEKRPHPVT